jgi:virulence-associated protein VapD
LRRAKKGETTAMMIMEIRFDEEKVLREDEYDLDKMHGYLDEYFLKNGFEKKEDGVYITNDFDDNKNYTRCGLAMMKFDKLEWFTENVSLWNWHLPHAFNRDEMVYNDIPKSLSRRGYRFPAYAQQEA